MSLRVNNNLCRPALYWGLRGEVVQGERLSVRESVARGDGGGDRAVGAPRGGRIPLKGSLLCWAGAAPAWNPQQVLWELCEHGELCGLGSPGDKCLQLWGMSWAGAGAVCSCCGAEGRAVELPMELRAVLWS